MLRAMLVSSCRLIGSRHGRMVNLGTTNGEGKALVDKTILVNLAAVERFDRVIGTCRETPSCGHNQNPVVSVSLCSTLVWSRTHGKTNSSGYGRKQQRCDNDN